MPDVAKGLEGVVVAETKISKVDGEKGVLTYRGYDINDLAEHSTFEETTFLLWYGRLPMRKELEEFTADLASRRKLPPSVAEALTRELKGQTPMAALRTGVSMLSAVADEPPATAEGALTRGRDILAQVPLIVAAHARGRVGQQPVARVSEPDCAGAFLQALLGEPPADEPRRALDVALVLHADHGFNASTFSARVTASTLSDVYSATTAGIGTLKGALHGGANTNVMRLLEEIGTPAKTAAHVTAMLGRHERVPGFGHRVYKVMDPRASHLKRMSRELGEHAGETKWYEMTAIIEKVMMDERKLWPNVDSYSASAYHSMGIPTEIYTPIFAISRTAGWLAHIAEQYGDNRLIRPRSTYVGPTGLTWAPAERR